MKKTASSVFKALIKRHHLALARNVPIEESAISLESVLSHGGGMDSYLAGGAVGHSEVSIALRQLPLKDSPKTKTRTVSIFLVAVPQDNSHYSLIISPDATDGALLQLIHHSQGKQHKALSDALHHQIYMKHIPQPDEQAYGRQLAAKLPEAVNLEQNGRQLVLFTTEIPDSNQAERLLRLAIELS